MLRSETTNHVLLYGIHPVLELIPGGIHVGDHGSDVPDDGGEDEHANQEVNGDKCIPEEGSLDVRRPGYRVGK